MSHLLELIAEAASPVEERKRREKAFLRDFKEKVEALNRAAKAVEREQEGRGTQSPYLAVEAAYRKVDAQLYQMLKSDGAGGLSSPEMAARLTRTLEGELVERGVRLADLSLTPDVLTEQLGRYAESVGRDPSGSYHAWRGAV